MASRFFGLILLLTNITLVFAKCFEPSPAFPVPQWNKSGLSISTSAFSSINDEVEKIDKDLLIRSSFSIEVTSSDDTLWTKYHSAQEHDKDRPGVTHVDGDSQYRVASITKVLTTLGLLYQHESGKVSLDDPIDKYIPELKEADRGELPWKDITLRILASQLSGIPRDFAIGAVVGNKGYPPVVGLPQLQGNITSPCPDVENNGTCTRPDLLRAVKQQKPIFAPNQKSTYSNDAFELLGLVLEETSGQTYSDYITEAILKPLNMSNASFTTPSDDHAVLSHGNSAIWDVDQGVQRPTGGLYASASDLSKFLRHVLKHYNSIATGVNWLLPASWATGMQTFYGMPWEILRSDSVLEHSRRPVSIVGKSGGLPGYFSQIFLLPEYDLGVTILVAGNFTLLAQLQEIVLTGLIQAAEAAVWDNLATIYDGNLIATNSSLNSSLSLKSSPTHGLTISKFVSNGTDMLATVIPQMLARDMVANETAWHAQLVPTLLFKNETTKQGEIWRMLVVQERAKTKSSQGLFDDYCLTDIDTTSYGSFPLNEVVFWHEEGLVEVPVLRVVFKPATDTDRGTEAGSGSAFFENLLQRIISYCIGSRSISQQF